MAWLNGNRIRELRQKKGWIQRELAEAVGIAQPQISDLELTGRIPFGHRDLPARLASVLGTTTADLRSRAKPRKPDQGQEIEVFSTFFGGD